MTSRTVLVLPAILILSIMIPAFATAATYHVQPDGSGDFPTIQAALDAAVAGDEVLLASGTFRGPHNRDLNFHGRAVELRSESSDPATCTLDAESRGRGFLLNHGEGSGTLIQGITIRNAQPPEDDVQWGGAIRCDGSSPSVFDCAFDHCFADWGAGLFITGGSPTLVRCTFYMCNTPIGAGDLDGGAIHIMGGSVRLAQCTIDWCLAMRGGALFVRAGSVSAYGCVIRENFGTAGAPLFLDYGSTIELSRCTVFANIGDERGQIVLFDGSRLEADRTILATWPLDDGDFIPVVCDGSSTAELACCDVFGHGGGDWVGCLAGQENGQGNLHLDPLFCDIETDVDLRLRGDSPCAEENNPTCGQIGFYGIGCDAPVPTRGTTWGRVRGLFR